MSRLLFFLILLLGQICRAQSPDGGFISNPQGFKIFITCSGHNLEGQCLQYSFYMTQEKMISLSPVLLAENIPATEMLLLNEIKDFSPFLNSYLFNTQGGVHQVKEKLFKLFVMAIIDLKVETKSKTVVRFLERKGLNTLVLECTLFDPENKSCLTYQFFKGHVYFPAVKTPVTRPFLYKRMNALGDEMNRNHLRSLHYKGHEKVRPFDACRKWMEQEMGAKTLFASLMGCLFIPGYQIPLIVDLVKNPYDYMKKNEQDQKAKKADQLEQGLFNQYHKTIELPVDKMQLLDSTLRALPDYLFQLKEEI